MSAVNSPFGASITADTILEDLSFFDSWQDRYKYIIDLGKSLPAMDDVYKVDANIIPGCQSKVWIQPHKDGDKLYFDVDSDAFIVKGLIGILMSAYNGKSHADILGFDIEAYFEEVGLIKHLSMARGNGLRSMVERIRSIATA